MVVLMSRHAPASPGRHARSTNNHAQGTRTPISDVIHCSTGHRIMIHWARGDEGPPQRSINNGIPIIDPHPSQLTPRPRETTPRAPTLPHKLKQRLHDQTRAVAAPDTLVYSNPIGRRISHDMVGPYTISHDLPRSPTTWSAQTRSPTIFHDLPRHGRPIDRQLTVPQPSWP